MSGGEIESVLLVVFLFFSLGQIPPQTSSSGLKGGALYHPVGLVQSLEELLLLLLRQEARLCRLDVLQDTSQEVGQRKSAGSEIYIQSF